MVGPGVLVILDGASEPWDGSTPTSLERACTPALDTLARAGVLTRARTVAVGLPAGSETAIPALLGWTPTRPVDRGAIEAAAHRIPIARACRAWRIDALDMDRARADPAATARAALALAAASPTHAVHRLGGHRLLLVGPEPLPEAARAAHLRVWPDGDVLPRILDERTVVVAARGAAAGVAALLGARVLVPDGATGDPASDLDSKARAAIAAMTGGTPSVVVHLGGADEAAHARDGAGKVAFIERADRQLIAPLAAAVARADGTLRVCPDHGCDPATGAHDAHPVPHLSWSGFGRLTAGSPARLSERAVASLPVSDLTGTAVAA